MKQSLLSRPIRVLRAFGAAVTLLTLAALSGCAEPQGGDDTSAGATPGEVRIGLSYVPNVQFAPFYVADARGYFARGQAQVVLRHHGANEGLFQALAAGYEHFLLAGGAEAMLARDAGVDMVAVASYYREFPVRIIVPGDSTITELADLRGKRIGVAGRFGESWLGLLVALQSAGLSESEVTIFETGFTQLTALTTGKVDAVVGFSTNEEVQIRLADPAARALPVAAGEVPLVSSTLFTTRSFAEQHPEIVREVIQAMRAGIETAAADEAATLEMIEPYIPGLRQSPSEHIAPVLTAAIELMGLSDGIFDPSIDAARWEEMGEFLARHGHLAEASEAATAFSNDFV